MRRHRISVVLLLLSTLASVGHGTVTGADRLDVFIDELNSEDLFAQRRAEAEIRKYGHEALEKLADRQRRPGAADDVVVQSLFAELLDNLLREYEGDFRDLVEEKLQVQRLADFLKTTENAAAAMEAEERRKNLLDSIQVREPRVAVSRARIVALMPLSFGGVLGRIEYAPGLTDAPAVVAEHYAKILDEALAAMEKTDVCPAVESDAFATRHYALAPCWHWSQLRGDLVGTETMELLDRHMTLAFEDLQASPHGLRQRAENAFFLLGQRAIDFFKPREGEFPYVCAPLLELLNWRIHPRVRERTSMDFRDYRELGFRARRRHIIDYARTAGADSVPTLRLIVYDDSRESSIRVKLTAAEALAGLGDLGAIKELSRRRIPELLKIPEISRDLFLLKGIQYQEEKQFELAIAEFQKILSESPFHYEANYRIAFVYLLVKEFKKSIHHFEIARRIRPEDTFTLYNLSCALSLDGQIEKALETLEKAVESGFDDLKHIESDTDLDPLREQGRYQRVIENLRRKQEKP